MTFRVGQKVVCVVEYGPLKHDDEILPIKGDVYTVGEICVFPEATCLRVVEIVNPPHDYQSGRVECAFSCSGFRPVVETDISIFTAMLNPSKQEIEA